MMMEESRNQAFQDNLSSSLKECGNILVQGDNKDVLLEMRVVLAGRVKCIYIDPPYNNGETYH